MATCHPLSGATWRKHCSPPSSVNLRSTAAGPPVNGGQRWRTTVDHRRTTGQPPVNVLFRISTMDQRSFYPDAATFSDGKPASEAPELNLEDVMARLEDLEVEIDTLHADAEEQRKS
ncbi:hypothetical protein Tco_0686569 [Tanacetum coccineum]